MALLHEAMQEVFAVGRACGISFVPDVLDPMRAAILGAPAKLMPLMAVDLCGGNRLELPWLAGRVVQLGLEHHVPTPVNRVIYAGLKPYISGGPG